MGLYYYFTIYKERFDENFHAIYHCCILNTFIVKYKLIIKVMLFDKKYKVSIFTFLCLFANYAGSLIATKFSLPLWLDSIGIVTASYVLGPACGAVVGITKNLLDEFQSFSSFLFSFTSIAIAVIVGISAKKKMFETFFGTVTVSVLLTFAAIAISVPISIFFCDGKINNIWGDGVAAFLKEQNVSNHMSLIIGQFYIEFLDKFITLAILYLCIHGARLRNAACIKNMRKRMLLRFLSFLYNLAHFKDIFRSVALFFVFALLAFNLSNANASELPAINSYVQTIYSRHNGLPCGEANCIAQTPDGILWIGTYAGLYRYNGSEFRRMTTYDSIRNVNCLFVDEEGRLFIGTNDSGLSICINEKIQNVIDINSGLNSSTVRCMTKNSEGFYYIGTSAGLQIISLNSGIRFIDSITDYGFIRSIAAGKKSYVAAINSRGKLFLLHENKIIYTENSKENFLSCTFDKDGFLYCGTRQNVIHKFRIDHGTLERLESIDCGKLSCINGLKFNNGKLFICADTGIGYVNSDKSVSVLNTESFDNSIDTMLSDYQGNYWFTSSRLGLLKMSNSAFVNLYSQLGMEQKVVNAVALWNGGIYVGTDSGLDLIKENHQAEDNVTSVCRKHRIRCIKKDAKNHLWIASYGHGLYEFLPDGSMHLYDNSIPEFGNRVRCILERFDGTIISADEKGLSFIQNQNLVYKLENNRELRSSMTLSLMEYDKRTVFAGTNGDGLAIIKDGKVDEFLTLEDGLTSGVILRTVKESDGEGVFAVTSNGLCYILPDSKAKKSWKIRVIRNFPYFNNFDIQISKAGKLFVLGSAGIYVVNQEDLVKDEEHMQYELLDLRSGLASSLTANAWNHIDEDETLYLSSDAGVYTVKMNDYQKNKSYYRMMLSTIKIDNQYHTFEKGEVFVINRNAAKIELFPEVVNYAVQNPYVRYWLEGFDTEKTTILQSELTGIAYTNLPSRNYVFHMEVLDNKGRIMEQNQWHLYKQKDIYDNSWFKLYMLSVAMIAIAWFTWFIVKTQIQRTLEFQKKQILFAQEQVKLSKQTILTIAKTVDARDKNTSQHSMRVSQYAVLIAEELGMSKQECENISMAALLHDIGKIGISDRILHKPARLTDEEYAVMKSHVTRGAEILKDFSFVEHVSDGVLYHHERYDGTGYVKGLKGEDIPIYGRIIGVADAFDAMTANRVYRKQQSLEYVISELKRGRGTQFDPKIVDILLKLIEKKKIDTDQLYNNEENQEDSK